MKPWIGVDLDGTLSVHRDGQNSPDEIGEPVSAMLERVRGWMEEGISVKIFTARVSGDKADVRRAKHYIKKWLEENGLGGLEITCIKDYGMVELYDDRAVQVGFNTGELLGDSFRKHRKLVKEDENST